MNKKLFFYLQLLLLFIFSCGCYAFKSEDFSFHIRTSQVGYLNNELKTAVILSDNELSDDEFEVRSVKNDNIVYNGTIKRSKINYSKFQFCYNLDFSGLKNSGKYFIKMGENKSYPFEVGSRTFNSVVDSLMLFFQVQRCGPTNPLLHEPCHLSDVTSIFGYPSGRKTDVTGGWHDAADYVKFFSTTAYSTYLLLFAYEFDQKKFSYDNNRNNVPDILEEARVGIDWLLRSNFEENKYITQIQDLRDHGIGLRLPENDSLQFDRPGFVGTSKNIIGMYSAVLALASRIWSSKFYDYEFAKKCSTAAEKSYQFRNSVPDVDKSGSGYYHDVVFWGKLALGAVELYNLTRKYQYLKDAELYADSAGSDYWWSWGNINSLAHFKLAKINSRFAGYIYNNLNSFNTIKNNSLFNEGIGFSWGSTVSILGVSLQSILYKNLTGSSEFDSLAVFQRDYVLGRNPWGLSFIYNIGIDFSRNLHSQVGHFYKGYIPGALTAGPVPQDVYKNYTIQRNPSKYDEFNTDSVKYYDDSHDYITNEPTITGNSTAIFVFGYYSNR